MVICSSSPKASSLSEACALCQNTLPAYPQRDQELAFCCPGCHAVYQILSNCQQLENYETHPIFQQAIRAGLISNPLLLEQIRLKQSQSIDGETERLHLEILEMWCPSCAQVIQLILLQTKGIANCVVDYATDLAAIEFNPKSLSKNDILSAIRSLGYGAKLWQSSSQQPVSFSLYLRFAIAAFCSLNVMMFAYPLYATYFDADGEFYGSVFAWLSFGFSIPVLTYSAWPIFRRFWNALQTGLVGMETLVVLSVTTAFALSLFELIQGRTWVYFDTLTVIITFVLLGKIMEAKAKFSAKEALFHLVRSVPRRGRKCFENGIITFVPVKDILVNDLVEVWTGEKIVLDGVVVSGQGGCDESVMTGEAVPVVKSVGDLVLAGTILQSGALIFRVTSSVEESALSRIIDVVQADIGHKSVYVRAADRIIRWFVPLVISIALVTALYCIFIGVKDSGMSINETAWIRAMSVLLISCPCAIGIAAPLVEAYLMNQLASLGVIVRNRGCLEVLGRETVYVFDKTGTVTEGNFHVLSGLEELTSYQLAILKGMTGKSIHPVANAICAAISESPWRIDHLEEVIGQGILAVIGEERYLLGSLGFLQQNGIAIAEEQIQRGGYSEVYFVCQGVVRLLLGDQIRTGLPEWISSLPSKKILLSGDSIASVEAVAKTCGFDEWYAGCRPLQKRALIERLRKEGHLVMMIGDGINDAPALTAAHVGISVIAASDISIQVSDLLLTTDKLTVISSIQSLAQRGHYLIRQNLFWAFFYNVIGLGLAASGLLSPIFSAAAMVASSLIVLFNAKRAAL